MKYLFIVIFILIQLHLYSQNYNDVAVLMNTNDPESVLIGEYFQDKHDIPDDNMIFISMPTTELIDSFQYRIIVEEVRVNFNSMPQGDEINYIVTTKGCPQVVELGPVAQSDLNTKPFEILMSNFNTTGYFTMLMVYDEHFSFADAGYRIVSRLESGTLEGTYQLIDRGGVQNIDLNLNVVLDLYAPFTILNGDGVLLSIITEQLKKDRDTLTYLGFNTVLDTDINFYNGNEEISIFIQKGYAGDNVPISPFVEKTKSFGIVQLGFSALKSKYGGGLTVFDFLEANCHAAMGYVDNFFISGFNQSRFLNYYLDVERDLTIGESIYASISVNSALVLFGDPKSKVGMISSTSNLKDPIILDIFPIPTKDVINIDFESQKERYVVIYDNNGKFLLSRKINNQENKIDVSNLPSGFLLVAIQEGEKVDVRKIVKL